MEKLSRRAAVAAATTVEKADPTRGGLVSRHLRPGWFSLRTHGTLVPNRGTIRNMRPAIKRNRLVKVANVMSKMKRSVIAHLPIPHEVIK